MITRAATLATAAVLPLAGLGLSQSATAQGFVAPSSYETATRACWSAASNDASGQFNAGDIKSGPPAHFTQIGDRQAKVQGNGFASGTPFSYSCTVNLNNGQAYNVEVRASGGGGSGGIIPGMEWNNRVPQWAVGNWNGYSPSTNQALAMSIHSDGRVTGNVNGFPLNGKIDRYGQIQIGISWYSIIQTPDGLMTQQVGFPSNVVYYHRV